MAVVVLYFCLRVIVPWLGLFQVIRHDIMLSMDALLSGEARETLEALAISRSPASAGILLGHRRGLRFIIERAIPTGCEPYPSLSTYIRLNSQSQGRIIGFFSLATDTGPTKTASPPFAVGKVYLCFKGKSRTGFSWRAFHLDYEGVFIRRPIRLATLGGNKP